MMIELVDQTRDRSCGAMCNLEGGATALMPSCAGDDTMIRKLTVKAYG